MRQFLITAALVVLVAGPVNAADMPVKASPPAERVLPYSWTGFYVGLFAGGSLGRWQAISNTPIFGSDTFTSNPRLGAFGGGQVGLNWQFDQWIIGIEADRATGQRKRQEFTLVQGSDPPAFACDEFFPSCTYVNQWQLSRFGTVRGRLGFASDRWLIYATGGYAYGEARYDVSLTGNQPNAPIVGAIATDSVHKSGWTAGSGVEVAIDNIWSVKLEYLYFDLGSVSVSTANHFGPTQHISDTIVSSYHIRDHILRLGVNLRFGPPQ